MTNYYEDQVLKEHEIKNCIKNYLSKAENHLYDLEKEIKQELNSHVQILIDDAIKQFISNVNDHINQKSSKVNEYNNMSQYQIIQSLLSK